MRYSAQLFATESKIPLRLVPKIRQDLPGKSTGTTEQPEKAELGIRRSQQVEANLGLSPPDMGGYFSELSFA
jgi:hypothetical protein